MGAKDHLRLIVRRCLLGVGLPFVLLTGQLVTTTRASAANVVNVTFHVPATIQTNPCIVNGDQPDVVNLNGDIHIVISSTAEKGGYQVDNHLNSQFMGTSIVTGNDYVSS